MAPLELLAFPIPDGFEVVAVRAVVRCESAQSYSTVFLSDGRKILVSKGLSALERGLPDGWFVRCHDRFLVGRLHVRRFLKKDGLRLVMADGAEIPVAQRRRAAVIGCFLGV